VLAMPTSYKQEMFGAEVSAIGWWLDKRLGSIVSYCCEKLVTESWNGSGTRKKWNASS
jgi:hypothetical protein